MSFLLLGPSQTVVADGAAARYPDIADAQTALRAGRAPMVVGALPFDVRRPAALVTPQSYRVTATAARRAAGTLPAVRIDAEIPSPAQHLDRIRAALDALRDPARGLQKVVLARSLRLGCDAPLDPLTLLYRLAAADPEAHAYLVDLSAAGGRHGGRTLVGASPELLVVRRGDTVCCRPFAGSAPRGPTPEADAQSAAALASSAKNRHEHALVVDAVRAALTPLCRELEIPDEPQLSRTAALWHLATPITGRLREPATTALDLALALHPTPAVGGVPTADAVDLIAELEGDRGFYAGAVGWCDSGGDGRWVVAIRCADVAADGRSAHAYAGGGIVAESDPDDELAETATKFRTVLTALGVPT
ncbi:isochorismate synthase [Mycobacterium sp. MYCO198283]|uniref:isochorismate synthase n=1 Tax=Mycobacterium sp. MYCO198283 TaxID=2883505 RepID=UPI001E495BA7|nr:isochorismate synthase [Mycobacterium sp. MYCO198283]MCG5431585.1 isochorismate synthase [Mycobacterium sp. MYCO198283]